MPAVYDCGTDGDDLYLVMQLINGNPLTDLIAEVDRVPVGWAAAIAAQVCSVLAVAHANSLVHRDLKPANLMLCPDGTVKVLDFGVAAALSPSATKLTATGVVIGTAEYMAPEQTMSGTTSPQTDLYSLGVILHELLAGENQFAAGTPLACMRKHVDEPPRPVRELRPDVPEGLERLILWLLAKRPADRPQSAALVYERLVPFCRDLSPLPGFVDGSAVHPVRMYAAVVGRVAVTATKAPAVEAREPGRRVLGGEDIQRVRRKPARSRPSPASGRPPNCWWRPSGPSSRRTTGRWSCASSWPTCCSSPGTTGAPRPNSVDWPPTWPLAEVRTIISSCGSA